MSNGLKTGVCAAVIAATLALTPQTASAQAGGDGLAGAYLAANQAEMRDDYAAAADYYDQAIMVRPDNMVLLNNAAIVNVIAGRMPRAQALAEMLEPIDPSNQMMALTLVSEALKAEDYDRALEFVQSDAYGWNPIFRGLVEGWALVGKGDFAGGAEVFGAMNDGEAMTLYGRLNQAVALAYAGDFASAATLLDGDEQGPLHLNRLAVLTHIVSLSQAERADEALALLEQVADTDPELQVMREKLTAGEELMFTHVTSAAEGAAAVYAMMGRGLIQQEEAERLGLVYARLALHIDPRDDEVLTLIGETLAFQGRYALAIEAFEGIAPSSPWYTTAEVGRAQALADLDREDEAVEVLSNLARTNPDQIAIQIAHGDILRESEAFAGASQAYTRAIDLVEEPDQRHWRLFYARGVTYERTDNWPAAEADFRKALELNPDQPFVLNYLGYSMVELGQNLTEAEEMIRKAVEQRSDDGFITDSLGWVLYKLGRYDEAVEPMERAVELEPVDPIINDHLGDVLWMVGRKLEAEFQWRRALSFDPEEEDAERIRQKLDIGLDAVLDQEAAADPSEAETAHSD
ncbi:tetratricopeptide repeat protein [Oceanibium sediminis]|uniref:tetratricopeptide repeat protein n=1 Tax=Oceanibium sediminis TaxID=2026339 RepID=UPI000DD35040|nr:tetratricopeptide repeat protein [Oceanibium sediminis]